MSAIKRQPHNRFRARRRAARRGSTLVQTAIMLPMVLLFLFGILEYSRYVMLLQILNNAAREGCRYAVMHTNSVVLNGTTYGNNTSDVTTIVTNTLAGQALASQAVSVYGSDALGNNNGNTWQNTQSGQWITVKITGNFASLLPTFLHMASTIPITAESVMRSESN
jgi:Flp pilus assembly protein TadG